MKYTQTSYPIEYTNTISEMVNDSNNNQYQNKIINNNSFNSVFLFTQYTNYNDMLNNADLETMYNNSLNYFSSKNITKFLLGLTFGSGVVPSNPPVEGEGNGFFTLGQDGSIASIYQALTPKGTTHRYLQSNGQYITVTGTGTYTYSDSAIAGNLGVPLQFGQYNCILFDVELATNSGPDKVNVSDFINLYKYIKSLYPNMLIITIVPHTSSYYIPDITNEIIKSDLSDFVGNLMYTQMFGTTNEYSKNYNLSWSGFFENLSETTMLIVC
jgi:hypothetical protein